jgi:CDP-6-deoxy-D-xylo-4-hexulose-3-dehydrase
MHKISLVNDTITNGDIETLIDWLRTGPQLTKGEETLKFEKMWADWVERKYAVFVNSGSSANLLMYAAGQEYIRRRTGRTEIPTAIQGMSWATTVAPAIQLGLDARLIDVCPHTWGMDPASLEPFCKDVGTSPFIVTIVHTIGCPVDINGIQKCITPYNSLILEDCCSSYGSTYGGKGRKVGTFGDMSSFSFYFAHQMSTVEGGMVCTDDDELYYYLNMMRSHGWAKDLPPEIEEAYATTYERTDFNRMFTFYVPGFNVRGTDINALIGQSQMKTLDKNVADRIYNHLLYQKMVVDYDLPVRVQMAPPDSEICSISFGIQFESNDAREAAANVLQKADVEIRPLGGGNIAKQPFWTDRYDEYGTNVILPICNELHDTTLMVPNHPEVTIDDIQYIGKRIQEAVGVRTHRY